MLLWATTAWAQPNSNGMPVLVLDEGTAQCYAESIDFVGAGVSCVCTGFGATCTISGGGVGGSPIILDLADDGANESIALAEIATVGDTNAIFTEPSADKLLIDVAKAWPTSSALAANPTDCAATQFATTIAANGNLTCAAITDADVPDTITIALAATATALAADGANCATDQWPRGVDTFGASQCEILDLGADTNGSYAAGDAEAGNATGVACADCVALTTETSGNYVATLTAGGGLTGTVASEGATPTVAVGAGACITVNADDVAVTNACVTAADLSCADCIGATEIAALDHGADLTGLSDDDHTQYALLAGRVGGQTLKGDTASGGDLTLQSTAHATRGHTVTDRLRIALTYVPDGLGAVSHALIFDSAFTSSAPSDPKGIVLTPTAAMNTDAAGFWHLSEGGTFNFNTLSTLSINWLSASEFWSLININTTNAFDGTYGYTHQPTVNVPTGVTGGTVDFSRGFAAYPVIKATGTGTITLTELVGLIDAPMLIANTGAGSVTVPTRRGVQCANPTKTTGGGGTVTLTDNVCVDVPDQTAGVTNTSLRSLGATVDLRHAGPARFGATGAPTATYDMDVQGPSQLNGTVALWPSEPNVGASTTATGLTMTPTVSLASGSIHRGISIAPTVTATGAAFVEDKDIGYHFGGTHTWPATANSIHTLTGMLAEPTILITGPAFIGTFQLFNANPTFRARVANGFNAAAIAPTILNAGVSYIVDSVCDSGANIGLGCTTDDTNASTGCGAGATCPNCCDPTAAGTTSGIIGVNMVPTYAVPVSFGAGSTWTLTSAKEFRSSPAMTEGTTSVLTITDHYGYAADALTFAGTPIVTRDWGFYSAARTLATSNFQYGAAEMAAASVGTVPSGSGAFYIESDTVPNRFASKDENQIVHYLDHTLLDGAQTTDSTAGTVVRGDLIVGNSTPKWARLAKGTASQCLQMDGAGTDVVWGACASAAGDITAVGDCTTGACFVDDTNAGTVLVYEGATVNANETRLTFTGDPSADFTVTIPNETGTICTTATGSCTNALMDGARHSDTTSSAVTRGDIVIGNSTPAWDDLAIGSANSVLKSDGTDIAWGVSRGSFSFSGAKDCGGVTNYFSNSGCNTTIGNIDFVPPFAFTMTGMFCDGIDSADNVVTYIFTLMKNAAADATFACTDTNEAGCNDVTGTVAFNGTSDTIAIRGEDSGASVGADAAGVGCTVFYTIP